MKIKMQTALDSMPALGALAAVSLPAVASYKVAMILRKLKEPLTVYDEKRTALLKEVGVPVPMLDKEGKPVLDKEGKPRMKEGQFTIPEGESRERWDKELKELGAADVDVPVSEIKVSELGGASVEPRVLAVLDWCFEEM